MVDHYKKGKVIPKCQFSASIVIQEGEDIPPLDHQVELKGAKLPHNILPFHIPPTGTMLCVCVCACAHARACVCVGPSLLPQLTMGAQHNV